MSNQLNFIDLFAGAGGLSEGFIQEGYLPIAHVEADAAACNTLRTRMAYHWLVATGSEDLYADYLNGKIDRDVLHAAVPRQVARSTINVEIRPSTLARIYSEIDSLLRGRELDLLIGGPPCQAYSLVGRSRDPEGMVEDKRNYLYECYAKFLGKYRPKKFLFENVTGLLSAKGRDGTRHFDAMRQLFDEFGYDTDFSVISAKDHGVLQNRKRVVLVGHQKGTVANYPDPEQWTPNATVSEVFRNLPPLGAGEGSVSPCRPLSYKSTWLLKAGVSGPLPVTWHQARPHSERDLEIYRIAVTEWNERRSSASASRTGFSIIMPGRPAKARNALAISLREKP